MIKEGDNMEKIGLVVCDIFGTLTSYENREVLLSDFALALEDLRVKEELDKIIFSLSTSDHRISILKTYLEELKPYLGPNIILDKQYTYDTYFDSNLKELGFSSSSKSLKIVKQVQDLKTNYEVSLVIFIDDSINDYIIELLKKDLEGIKVYGLIPKPREISGTIIAIKELL